MRLMVLRCLSKDGCAGPRRAKARVVGVKWAGIGVAVYVSFSILLEESCLCASAIALLKSPLVPGK